MASVIVVDQIKPERILQRINGLPMAFAESYKGEGGPSDANFQAFDTSWRRESAADVQEIWLLMFQRQAVIPGSHAGFNMCEFWGWPEVQCRDDGMARVVSRIRIIKSPDAFPQPVGRSN